MRIGMLADIYKPYVSGVTNHIALTKRALESKGHQVFVFTFGDEDYRDDEPNVIRSSGLPLAIPAADLDVQISLRYTQQAQRLLRMMDVVHVHHPSISGRLALRYCRPRRIPIVYTNHTRYDLYSQAYLPWMPDVVGEAFFRVFLPAYCRSMDLVIAPSNGLRDVLMSFGVEEPIEVVPNGIDLGPIRSAPDSLNRSDFGFSDENLLLTFVGRLGPEKNLAFLLRSFAGAAEAYDNLRLLLVGDGPELDNMRDRARLMGLSEKVRFTGMVDYGDVPSFLKMADVFVTASVTEVHPLTLIEAMAAGLPVLGIHSPGVGDIIVDGVTGMLAQEDMASFTAKMVRIATNQEEREAMQAASIREAERYAVDVTADELVLRYKMAIQKVKKQPVPLRYRLLRALDRVW